jgi:hypothetical protein
MKNLWNDNEAGVLVDMEVSLSTLKRIKSVDYG